MTGFDFLIFSDSCSPLSLENGFVSPKGEIPVGVAVSIFCDVGYRLIAQPHATCLESTTYNISVSFNNSTACIAITEGMNNLHFIIEFFNSIKSRRSGNMNKITIVMISFSLS